MSSNDTTIIYVSETVPIDSLHPGRLVLTSSFFTVKVDTNFSLPFRFNFTIKSDGWVFWRDTISIVASVEKDKEIKPVIFSLEQNYPNPFNASTTIKYSVPELIKVKLTLFNLLGEEVATLVNEEKTAGYYTLEFNAANLPSGVYFYRIQAGEFVQTKKMVLLK